MADSGVNQRILSLDAIKGFAAFMILIVHGVVFGVFTPDPVYFEELVVRAHPIFLAMLAPIILMATWFPVFLLIAGVTIAYSFVREFQKDNPNYTEVSKKKIVNALALIVLGAIYGPLLSHAGYNNGNEFSYSVITGFIDTGGPIPLDVPRFFGHSVFGGIGLGMFVLTAIFYIVFTRMPSLQNRDALIKTMIWLEIGFILLSFGLEWIVANTPLYGNIRSFSPFLHDMVSRLYGGRHSMLPQLFFGFSGAIYGIIIGFPGDKSEKHRLIRKFGWARNLVTFLIFLAIMLVTGFDYISFIVSPDLPILFHLGNLAMLNWLICGFFERFDFRTNYEDGVKSSAFLRTFGPVTMTVYCMESLFASIFRWIFQLVFGEDIFPWNAFAAVSYMVLIIAFWYYAIKLWSRTNYKWSFEWGVVMFMGLFGARSSRLQVKTS